MARMSDLTITTEASQCDEVRFFTRSEGEVNALLADKWVLLAAGTDPHGDATYVLGHNPNRMPKRGR